MALSKRGTFPRLKMPVQNALIFGLVRVPENDRFLVPKTYAIALNFLLSASILVLSRSGVLPRDGFFSGRPAGPSRHVWPPTPALESLTRDGFANP